MKCDELNATLSKLLKYKDIIALCFSILLAFLTLLLIIISSLENSFNYYGTIIEMTTSVKNTRTNAFVLSETPYPYVYIYLPHYPFLFLSILAFVLSLLAISTNVLFLFRKVKKYPVIGMLIVTLLFLVIFTQTYFWIALNGAQHMVNQFYYHTYSNAYFTDPNTNTQYEIVTNINTPYQFGEFDTICFFGTFITIISLLSSSIYVVFHYLFSSNLEGPTMSEMINGWATTLRSSIFGGGKQGYMLVKNKLWGNRVIKIRKSNSQFFKEVELASNTYEGLVQVIANTFTLNIDDIQEIIKDGNTILSSDDDVRRLTHGATIEFTAEGQMESNINNNNQSDHGQFIDVEFVDE